GIRDWSVTGVQTCALPIYQSGAHIECGGFHFDLRTRLRNGALKNLGYRHAHELPEFRLMIGGDVNALHKTPPYDDPCSGVAVSLPLVTPDLRFRSRSRSSSFRTLP